jgi:hypothetical protein
MSTPQGTGWTPGDAPVPPWQAPTPAPPGTAPAASAPPPWQAPPTSSPSGAPAPAWAGRGGGAGTYAGGSPEVTTTAAGLPTDAAADPYAEIDPFRTDGSGAVYVPPPTTGGMYRLDAPAGTWGPPPVWAPPPRTDPLAVVALVLGITGLILFPLVLSQVALILGIVAARRVRRTGDQGFGLAVTGIVLGSIGTLIVLGTVALFASIAWWSL